MEQLKRELMEQQCTEEKLSALTLLLGEPLNQLGTKPPPPAVPNVGELSSMVSYWLLIYAFITTRHEYC